jgi:hypothetical protein
MKRSERAARRARLSAAVRRKACRGRHTAAAALASEFVERHVNVLVAVGGDASARAAKAAAFPRRRNHYADDTSRKPSNACGSNARLLTGCVLRCGTGLVPPPVPTSWSDRTLDVGGYLGSMNCWIP